MKYVSAFSRDWETNPQAKIKLRYDGICQQVKCDDRRMTKHSVLSTQVLISRSTSQTSVYTEENTKGYVL